MLKMREGIKLIKEFDGKTEHIVAMIQFKEQVIVATNLTVYKMVGDVLEPLEIWKSEV